MKIKELIKALKKLDPEERIMLASDAEGNDYRDIFRIAQETNEEGNVTTIYPE